MRKELTHAGSSLHLLGADPSEALRAMLSNDEQVDQQTPPAFLVQGTNDRVVKPENSKRYHEACKQNGVPTKLVLSKVVCMAPHYLTANPQSVMPRIRMPIQWSNGLTICLVTEKLYRGVSC